MGIVHSYSAHAVARALTPKVGTLKAQLLASLVDRAESNMERFGVLLRYGVHGDVAREALKRAGYTRVKHDLCATCGKPVLPRQTSAIHPVTKAIRHEGCV